MTSGTAAYTVADYLLGQLAELGVEHAFDVPGDDNLACRTTSSPTRRSSGSAAPTSSMPGAQPDDGVCPQHAVPAVRGQRRRAWRGHPVDVGAGVARWFTAGELAADGPAVHYARALLEQADRRAWAAALYAIATYDASARVAAVRVPTASVAAELDPVSTPEAMGDIVALLPSARLQVLAGAMHMSPFTDPHALAAGLRAAAEWSG